ncbi:DAPG hydrolase family protein [Nocardia blacklockiae]|uniref:DAPG hydrolase family protein n=1 Tax=Nocardia blacklockiae TaxID=480036 RepID=UPI001895F298|nr:hypothetical protein [Nocardia blacklockiae]MBF6171033.1 hypothetical protein [Nocardia blacklockiae]
MLTNETNADAAVRDERYRGYSPADRAQPYARFFAERTLPAPGLVAAAYARPATPARLIPEFDELTDDLSPAGALAVETGYGHTAAGAVWVAVLTVMPGGTAPMWDWWFGWHLNEPARFKLWHPEAHLYAGAARNLSDEPIPDRDKYLGNTVYVDEYFGTKIQQLALTFHDPLAHGFTVPDEHTIILARIGSAVAPLDLGWLAHQVRPIPGGCEIRSRIYLKLFGPRHPDVGQAARAVARGLCIDPADLALELDLARELLLHCGQEMNHLASILPDLHREFATPTPA